MMKRKRATLLSLVCLVALFFSVMTTSEVRASGAGEVIRKDCETKTAEGINRNNAPAALAKTLADATMLAALLKKCYTNCDEINAALGKNSLVCKNWCANYFSAF